jgi:predicted RNA-binding protein YlxR (DUF448 family)
MTEFKPIPSCPGYQASACGQIKGPKKLLKLYKNKNGYLMFKPGFNKPSCYVHRAVAEAWNAKGEGFYVNHIDHNKLNNSIDNLEWCTAKHNHDECVKFLGKHPSQRLTQDNIKLIFSLREKGFSQRAIAKEVSCSQAHVWHILNLGSQKV